MIRESDSAPARDGPYGTKPRLRIVSWFMLMLTTVPPPSRMKSGATAAATRK